MAMKGVERKTVKNTKFDIITQQPGNGVLHSGGEEEAPPTNPESAAITEVESATVAPLSRIFRSAFTHLVNVDSEPPINLSGV